MNISSLVKMKDDDSDKRDRMTGIVLNLDWYHPDSSAAMIRIAEVLWDSGPSWIDASRIESADCLTDEQLEFVCGGMCYERFERWKVNLINNE